MNASQCRVAEIENLRTKLNIAMKSKKRKTATLIFARLHSLVLRQINSELRNERKAA